MFVELRELLCSGAIRRHHKSMKCEAIRVSLRSKGQKAVHACMIRLLNLGPAKYEKVAIHRGNCEMCIKMALENYENERRQTKRLQSV